MRKIKCVLGLVMGLGIWAGNAEAQFKMEARRRS